MCNGHISEEIKRVLWVYNGHISEEIKGVLQVCNGRPFNTYFGTSYLDDSFFYTHQNLNSFSSPSSLIGEFVCHVKRKKEENVSYIWHIYNASVLPQIISPLFHFILGCPKFDVGLAHTYTSKGLIKLQLRLDQSSCNQSSLQLFKKLSLICYMRLYSKRINQVTIRVP